MILVTHRDYREAVLKQISEGQCVLLKAGVKVHLGVLVPKLGKQRLRLLLKKRLKLLKSLPVSKLRPDRNKALAYRSGGRRFLRRRKPRRQGSTGRRSCER